jgi:hypothetical protein
VEAKKPQHPKSARNGAWRTTAKAKRFFLTRRNERLWTFGRSAKRSASARTKKKLKKTTRKKKPAPKPTPALVNPSVWEGFAGAKNEKKTAPKPAADPVAPSVWEGFGGKTDNH